MERWRSLKHLRQLWKVRVAAIVIVRIFQARASLRELVLELGQAHAGAVHGDEILDSLSSLPAALIAGDLQHRGFLGDLAQCDCPCHTFLALLAVFNGGTDSRKRLFLQRKMRGCQGRGLCVHLPLTARAFRVPLWSGKKGGLFL